MMRPIRETAVVAFALPAVLAAFAGCGSSGGGSGGAGPDGGAQQDATSDATTQDAASDAPLADAGSGALPGTDGAMDATTDAGSTGDAAAESGGPEAGDAATASDAAFDPQTTSCDGGGIPPVVGGTAACPGDKNLPGCPCTTVDASAACWTGDRDNRGAGDCRDGVATCTSSGVWGACTGEVLPVSGSSNAKAACDCFSTGQWAIANLEPCFLTTTDAMNDMTTVAYASTPGTPPTCPFDMTTGAPTVPAAWSTDTLTVDCSGYYDLCYTLKAGNPASPQPTDCVVAQTCTAAHYAPAGATVAFPPLPGWSTTAAQSACVQQFTATGGYGAMSVSGQTDECRAVSRVFQSVTYCPTGGSPGCMAGGGGGF